MDKIDADALLKEMENVPFGNSAFQNEHFTDGQEAPERRYRHALLQLHKKIGALKACEFRRQRIAIDIEGLSETQDAVQRLLQLSSDLALSPQQGQMLRRLEIDKAEKEWQLKSEVQLITDAMVEVETYRAMLNDLPKPTREEFEAAELGYWRKRLTADAKDQLVGNSRVDVGTLKSLGLVGLKMAFTTDKKICFIEDRKKLEEGTDDFLSECEGLEGGKANRQPERMPEV